MATTRKYRYRRNKRKRKIVWIKTDLYAKRYKNLNNYIKAVFKDDATFKELRNRLESETPGIFTNPEAGPLYGKYDDKDAIISFISRHAKQIQKDLTHKNDIPSHEQVLKALLNTRTFVSQEELIQNNIKTFLSKHKNKDFKDELRKALTKQADLDKGLLAKIDYSKFAYDPQAIVKNEQGTYDEVKAYVYEGSNVNGHRLALTMRGSGNNASPYTFKIELLETV